jgi:hypothetical protein
MSTFQGFSAPNQHTQTPNEFFDIMFDKKTKFGEVKLLGFLIRNTFGWHRAGNSLQFSFTELMTATGMAKETTNNSIKSCVEKGYIQRKEIDGQMFYRLNIADFQDYPWNMAFDWKKANNIPSKTKSVRKSNQFENRTGTKIEPKAVRKSNHDQFENRTDEIAEDVEPQGVQEPPKKLLKKTKEISSNSISNNRDLIDSKLKEKYADKPFDEIKMDMLNDVLEGKAVVDTDKQYQSLLTYRLKNYKAKQKQESKPRKQTSYRKKAPTRTEYTPDWYEDADTYYANLDKPKEQKPSISPEEAARKRAESLAMLAAIDGK